jgi:hypothetical protein
MATDDKAEKTKIKPKTLIVDSLKAIGQFLLGTEPQGMTSATGAPPQAYNNLYRIPMTYSRRELDRLPGQKDTPFNQQHMQSIEQFLKVINSRVKQVTQNNADIIALNPEIKKAAQIYVSTFCSPADLGEPLFNILVDDDHIKESIRLEVEEFLSEYFNRQFMLGQKFSTWLGEYCYEKPAVPILILPRANIDYLNKRATHNPDYKWNKGQAAYVEDDMFVATESLGMFRDGTTLTSKMTDKVIDRIAEKVYMEELEVHINSKVPEQDKVKTKEAIRRSTRSIVKKIGNSSVTISTDTARFVELISRNNTGVKESTKKYNDRFMTTWGGQRYNLFTLDENDPVEKGHHPLIMELPPSAVIPVTMVGSKSEHMGYFIILDEWNNPLRVLDNFSTGLYKDETSNLLESNMAAMFGPEMFTNSTDHLYGPERRAHLMNTLYSLTMRNILKEKFHDEGFHGLTEDKYAAISTCLFHQLLNQQRVTILFVPEALMVYYCDDYNDDGTGKNKLSSVDFVICLRTTLTIASILGKIEDAINHEDVTVTFDKKHINPWAAMTSIKSALVAKKNLPWSMNPLEISNHIVDGRVHIKPSGIPGLDHTIEIARNNESRTNNSVDDTLMEQLDARFMNNLVVPPSAINNLNEEEFARSVITNNLILNNIISKDQQKVEPKNNKLIRTYVKFSDVLLQQLKDIVKKHLTEKDLQEAGGQLHSDVVTDEDKPKEVIEITDDLIGAYVVKIIKSLRATLPQPNIAVVKSQIEELDGLINMIDRVIEVIYNQDLILSEDSKLKELMTTVAATKKAELVKEALQRISYFKAFEFEPITEIGASAMIKQLIAAINIKTGITLTEQTIMDLVNKASGGGDEDEFGGGGGMSF